MGLCSLLTRTFYFKISMCLQNDKAQVYATHFLCHYLAYNSLKESD